MELPDPEAASVAAAADPFAKLERGNEDSRRGRVGAERISELREDAAAKYSEDYRINKALRRQLRCEPRSQSPSISSSRTQLRDVRLLLEEQVHSL